VLGVALVAGLACLPAAVAGLLAVLVAGLACLPAAVAGLLAVLVVVAALLGWVVVAVVYSADWVGAARHEANCAVARVELAEEVRAKREEVAVGRGERSLQGVVEGELERPLWVVEVAGGALLVIGAASLVVVEGVLGWRQTWLTRA
jgi:hypothetical protein